MGPRKCLLSLLALLLAFTTGCATAVDMSTVNSRLDSQEARIKKLEQRPVAPAGQVTGARGDLDRVEKELSALRKTYADSQMNIQSLLEKIEALEAYIKESDLNMADLRKKGAQVDRSIENLTNRLEAEIRSLGEKIKELDRR